MSVGWIGRQRIFPWHVGGDGIRNTSGKFTTSPFILSTIFQGAVRYEARIATNSIPCLFNKRPVGVGPFPISPFTKTEQR